MSVSIQPTQVSHVAVSMWTGQFTVDSPKSLPWRLTWQSPCGHSTVPPRYLTWRSPCEQSTVLPRYLTWRSPCEQSTAPAAGSRALAWRRRRRRGSVRVGTEDRAGPPPTWGCCSATAGTCSGGVRSHGDTEEERGEGDVSTPGMALLRDGISYATCMYQAV